MGVLGVHQEVLVGRAHAWNAAKHLASHSCQGLSCRITCGKKEAHHLTSCKFSACRFGEHAALVSYNQFSPLGWGQSLRETRALHRVSKQCSPKGRLALACVSFMTW